MIKVVKFGGSSLASAAQFKKVGAIIRKEETRRYVVPSAPGKRHSGDTKVTDLLYKCYGQAILDDDREEDFEEILKVIKDRYDSIINGLELTISLDDEFKTIQENFSKKIGRDYAASRGEYLNGIIMAAYLKSFSLMKKENLTLRRQTKYCPRDWRIQSGQSFLDSMDLIRTEQSIHFPEEDLILQVLS